MKPHFAQAWYNLGWADKQQSQRSEVIKVYEKLKTLHPKMADEFFKAAPLP
jgi:glutathionyl-hydroquinone reductase